VVPVEAGGLEGSVANATLPPASSIVPIAANSGPRSRLISMMYLVGDLISLALRRAKDKRSVHAAEAE
jgi:hypothetical protein